MSTDPFNATAALADSLSVTSTQDDALTLLDSVAVLKDRLKNLAALAEAKVIEWINANGDITHGDVRYYVGTDKRTKCIDIRKTLDAVMVATGGDLDSLAGCLASDAFKHGACRTVLEADFDKHFLVTPVLDLREGKPKRGLHKGNAKFTKETDQ